MKHLNQYINIRKRKSTIVPKKEKELTSIILEEMRNFGNDVDLNHIDVSEMKSMFSVFNVFFHKEFVNFNGDISKWDVSNVYNMEYIFHGCENFNGDISEWDVHNVVNFCGAFDHCKVFNCDISDWDTSKASDMSTMFQFADAFNQPIGKWNTDKVWVCDHMFFKAKSFNQDLSSWTFPLIYSNGNYGVFTDCPIKEEWKPKNKWLD